MVLTFDVQNQTIKRTDICRPTEGSKNYLRAKFSFTDDWTGIKTAIFGHDGIYKNAILVDDQCEVPWEIIVAPFFTVSVVCGDLITANEVQVELQESGYHEGDIQRDPTPDEYAQLTRLVERAAQVAQSVRDDADAGLFKGEKGETGAAGPQGDPGEVANISQGEGERSLVFNDEESNRALASDSISAGTDTISGCKGYYISAIDFENKKVYLSETLVSLPATGAGEVDLTFATPAYEVGNDIGIMFSSHRLYFATIASVENNVVTYNGDLGFDASNLKEDADGYEFFVPQHPEIGSSVFTQTSFGFGEMIRAIGRCCALFGRELFGGNYTGLFGRNNKASTYSIGGGYGTISHATHAFFSGVSHILKGYCVGAIGAYLKVNGTCTFVAGDQCEFNANYASGHGVGLKCNTDGQHQVGRYNEEDEDATFVVGIGANESLRKNGFVAKKDGSATVSKQGTSDDSVVQKKYVDDAFTTKVTPLQTGLNKIAALFRFGTGGKGIMLGGGEEASGNYSGSWGLLAKAKGYVALALGYDTKAEGGMTLAGNRGTIAKKDNSTALGQYNAPNYTDIFQIGNGTSDTDRKNAFVVNMDGHAEVQVQGQTPNSVVTKGYADARFSGLEEKITGAKVFTGSYVGDGGFVKNLSFDRLYTVKYFSIAQRPTDIITPNGLRQGVWIRGIGSLGSTDGNAVLIENYLEDGNTFFVMHTNDETEENVFNVAETTYYWMAIVEEATL